MKRRWITVFIVVALVVVGVLGFIYYRNSRASAASTAFQTITAARGDLTATVGGTGTVRANQTTQLNWLTSGRIGEIKASLQQVVHKGDVLANLDPGTLSQNIIQSQADLINAKKTLDDLRNSNVVRAQAELTLTQAQKALDDAKDNRTNKNYQRASQATIDATRANVILAKEQLDKTQDIYSAVASRPQDDAIRAAALSQLSNARNAYDRAVANLNYMLGMPDAQEIAEADAKVAVAEANLKDAQRKWELVKDGPNPDDIAAAEARIAGIEATLNQTVLKAPFSGTITQSNSMVGDQVGPNTVSFRLDDLSKLLVDVDIPEVDISRVKVGQPATLVFDAITGKTYNGKVSEVGTVGTPSAGVVNFKVTVEMLDDDEQVKPGMTAAVNIIVDQVNNALLVPNRAVRNLNGKRVVYLLKPGNPVPQPVEIEIGSTSDINSELVSNTIVEGDNIVLNPPAQPVRGGPPGAGGGPGGGG